MTDAIPGEWHIVASARQYQGYTVVRRDRYRRSDGAESDWDVLEQPDTVAVIAFTKTGGVVLFDQYRVGPRGVLGELPGGLIDPGELPLDAGARELEEETGYRAGVLFHAGSEWSGANTTRRKHVVIGAQCEKVAEPRWEPGEFGVVHEIPARELVPHLLTGDLSDAGEGMRGLVAFARAEHDDALLVDLQQRVRRLIVESWSA